MTIRKATKADLDAIRALWEAMEDEIGGPEWVRETWEEEHVDVERRLAGLGDLPRRGRRQAGRPARARLREPEDRARPERLRRTRRPDAGESQRRSWRRRPRRRASTATRTSSSTSSPRTTAPSRCTSGSASASTRSGSPSRSTSSTSASAGSRAEESMGRVSTCRRTTRRWSSTRWRSSCPASGAPRAPTVSAPRNGWIEVDDELCGRDPKSLRRLGQELSYRTGGVVLTLGVEEGEVVRYVLLERGSIADEYASLPEYYGAAAAGRRDRARRQPDRRAPAHRRRPGAACVRSRRQRGRWRSSRRRTTSTRSWPTCWE